MSNPQSAHQSEVLAILESFPEGVRLGHLFEILSDRLGLHPVFHTATSSGLDFDDLIRCLEMDGRIRISKGMAFPSDARCCYRVDGG
jgi:hypothetical protein